jgi:hypothetical protein
MKVNVTNNVKIETLGDIIRLEICICGISFPPGTGPIITSYDKPPVECPNCHRKFIFTKTISILEDVGG